MLNALNEKQNLVEHLLENLSLYCTTVKSVIEQNPELTKLEREKMFLVSKKYSHENELAARLLFLEMYATETS